MLTGVQQSVDGSDYPLLLIRYCDQVGAHIMRKLFIRESPEFRSGAGALALRAEAKVKAFVQPRDEMILGTVHNYEKDIKNETRQALHHSAQWCMAVGQDIISP